MSSLNREIFRKSMLLSGLGFLGQIINFVTTLLIAGIYGSNWATDAYFLAFTVTVTFVTIIAGVIKIIFIPFMVEERLKNPDQVSRFVGATLEIVGFASLISVLVIFIISRTNLLSIAGHPEGTILTRNLMLELAPIIPLMMFSAVFNAIYNSYQRFGLAESANVLKNVFVIIALVLFSKSLRIHGLVIGNLIGQAVALILLLWMFYKKLGLSFCIGKPWTASFKVMLRESILPFFTVIFAQFHPLTANVVASMLDEGSVSLVNYAQKVSMIPMIVLGSGFTTVLLSYWAKSSVEEDHSQIQSSLNRSISMILTMLAPIVLVLFFLREPIIKILFHRGNFPAHAVAQTAELAVWFVIAIFPSYIQMIIVRILVAKKDTLALLLISALIFLFNPAIAYILAVKAKMGAVGIALATLISNLIVLSATVLVVHLRYVSISFMMLAQNGAKTIVAGVFLGGCLSWFQQEVSHSPSQIFEIFKILSVSILGFIVYALVLRVLRHPDLASIQKGFFVSSQ